MTDTARAFTEADAAALTPAAVVMLLTRLAELETLVVALRADNEQLRADNVKLRADNEKLTARVVALTAEAAKNSGNSSKPPSRDPVAERQRQAEERAEKKKRAAGGTARSKGKQRGSRGQTLAMTDQPDEVIEHIPDACGSCAAGLADAAVTKIVRRQVIEIPKPAPVVTEHQAQTRRCAGCGSCTTAAFPAGVRAPVSYGPRVHALVVYLLARQHLPVERCAEAMADLFGLKISTGTVDAMYARAGRQLRGFIAGLVAWLATLPVLHADETTDRIGTTNCWMHVLSTGAFTLIHASTTRGWDALDEVGVLPHYRGVIVHDRLALYFMLKKAKHGLCGAHLLRDLAGVAQVRTQADWSTALAKLLLEINEACHDARTRGHRRLAPTAQRAFAHRYDQLVTAGLAANPAPASGRKRNKLEAGSYNLAVAFRDRRSDILRFMRNLDVGFTNNQAERDLRPVKLHRKISSCFKSHAGAERFAHVRSYLSTTRKHNIGALDALTDLFNGNPWMPPVPAT